MNLEKRKYPGIDIDLPIEDGLSELFIKQGRPANASEGGLLLYLPERMEIGQHLAVKLFFPSDSNFEGARFAQDLKAAPDPGRVRLEGIYISRGIDY